MRGEPLRFCPHEALVRGRDKVPYSKVYLWLVFNRIPECVISDFLLGLGSAVEGHRLKFIGVDQYIPCCALIVNWDAPRVHGLSCVVHLESELPYNVFHAGIVAPERSLC